MQIEYMQAAIEDAEVLINIYNLRANTRDFSHEIQPFLHMHFTNYYNIS